MGVACSLFAETLDIEINATLIGLPTKFDNEIRYLPPKVMNFLNLNNELGMFSDYTKGKDFSPSLTNLAMGNDHFNMTFSEIAKYIRENPEKVFNNR